MRKSSKKMPSKGISNVGKVSQVSTRSLKGKIYGTGTGRITSFKSEPSVKRKPKTYSQHMKKYSKSPMFKAGRKRQRAASKRSKR